MLGCCLLPFGCQGLRRWLTPGPMWIKVTPAAYELGEQRLTIIPFRDPAFGYLESRHGLTLSEETARVLEKETDQEVARGLEVVGKLKGQDLDPPDWKRLGAILQTDLVLLGQITTLRTRDPKWPNLFRGQLEVTLQVVNLKTGRKEWEGRAAVAFPKTWQHGDAIEAVHMNELQVLEALLKRGGLVIARKFFEHRKE